MYRDIGKETYMGHVLYTREEMMQPYYAQLSETLRDAKIESMIDAGGCVGESAFQYKLRIPTLKQITIIEPIATNVAFMKGRFMDDPDINVIHNALWYGNDQVTMHIPRDSVGGANVFDERYDREVVNTVTLESLPKADFIKLDIEGGEENVILNSTRIKETPFLEIEMHHHNKEYDVYSLEERMRWLKRNLPHNLICELNGGHFFMKLWQKP